VSGVVPVPHYRPVWFCASMATSESQRHELYESIKAAHGESIAETFMNTDPPVDWDEFTEQLVTNADLNAGLAGLEARVAEVEARLLRTLGTWLLVSQGVVVAVVSAFGIFG